MKYAEDQLNTAEEMAQRFIDITVADCTVSRATATAALLLAASAVLREAIIVSPYSAPPNVDRLLNSMKEVLLFIEQSWRVVEQEAPR